MSLKASRLIENKNINFDNIDIDNDLKDIKHQINKEYIITLVVYFENMTKEKKLMNAFQKNFSEKIKIIKKF